MRYLIPAAIIPAAILIAALGASVQAPVEPVAGLAAAHSASSTTETRIGFLQERLRVLPNDAGTAAKLGEAYLQRARETADPAYYTKAEGLLRRAAELQPDNPGVLVPLGSLASAQHRFQDALALGERAKDLEPRAASAYGVMGDALVELGRYPEAFDAFQAMVDRRPDLASFARVSYARELTGDIDGALAAMRTAAGWAGDQGEAPAWARVQVGNMLLAYRGDVAGAEREYRLALGARAGYPSALAGLARLRATETSFVEAIALARQASDALPSLEHAILLSDLLHASGRESEAGDADDLVRVIDRLMDAAGIEPDPEMALFEADRRSDPAAAVAYAQRVYEARPSPKAAGALGWALYRAGDPASASPLIDEALRWGSRDPSTLYHAARIALALRDAETARAHASDIAPAGLPVRYLAGLAELKEALS
jgi:tetratricopeptide (TPR) repeat protein